jgi:multidrug efflux system membrane fusion protein
MITARARRTALLLAVLLVVTACGRGQSKGAPQAGPVPVTVGKVIEKSMPVRVAAIGNVQAYNSVSVRALVTGAVVRVRFREGQVVKEGELLFQIDPRPFQAALAQAQSTLARDQAQARNARADVERYASLVKKEYVTVQQYESARATAKALEATVRADRAAVETARINLGYCAIRAPLTGRTGQLLVQEGNIVQASAQTPLVVIQQLQPIYVAFSVPERLLPQLRQRGEPRSLRVIAAPPGGDGAHQGSLSFVDNSVNTTTGTILLKATFPNADQALWPGQFVNVTVTVAERPHAVVAPSAAVQRGQSGDYVFVVKPDGTVESRPVVVAAGGASGQEAVIEKGLAPGETVVTDGQLRLTPGSRVAVKEAREARG